MDLHWPRPVRLSSATVSSERTIASPAAYVLVVPLSFRLAYIALALLQQ